jgi:ubiquinone/menaquinone biosynthesis C-methylase UbiE
MIVSSEDAWSTPIRRWGRWLLSNDLIFDFGSWLYATMTTNSVWMANSAQLLDAVPPQADGITVLDLGAGPGNSALAMGERRPDARIIAFDLAQQMLQLAVSNRAAAGWSARRMAIVGGDALRLPLPDASVDAVTGHSFLYLLPDAPGVLCEAYRVLRPGGQVAFLEPHVGPVDWAWLGRQQSAGLQSSLTLWRVYSWLHHRFTPELLAASLRAAGFMEPIMEVTLGGFGIFGRAHKA